MRLQEVLFTLFRLQNKTNPITQKFFDRVSMGFAIEAQNRSNHPITQKFFDRVSMGFAIEAHKTRSHQPITQKFFDRVSMGLDGFWASKHKTDPINPSPRSFLTGFRWVLHRSTKQIPSTHHPEVFWPGFDGFRWVLPSKHKKSSLGTYHFWDVHVFHQTSHHAANEMRKSKHCPHRINESKEFWWRKKGEKIVKNNYWALVFTVSQLFSMIFLQASYKRVSTLTSPVKKSWLLWRGEISRVFLRKFLKKFIKKENLKKKKKFEKKKKKFLEIYPRRPHPTTGSRVRANKARIFSTTRLPRRWFAPWLRPWDSGWLLWRECCCKTAGHRC